MKNLKIGNLEVTKTNIIVITSCVLAGTLTGLGISAMEETTNVDIKSTVDSLQLAFILQKTISIIIT